MLRRKGHVGKDVLLSAVHEGRKPGQLAPHLVGHEAPLRAGCGVVRLGKGGGDEGRDHSPAALAGMGQSIPLKMHPTALPRGGEHTGGGGLDALMRIADHQLHARQAAAHEIAQELGPEGLRLRGPGGHAKNLAAAIRVHADRDGNSDADDPAALANLKVGGVDPEIGPFAFDRPGQESVDPIVDLLAQPADLAFGDAGAAHGLHQIVHGARRDAMNIGFLDHRRQRLLGGPAGLEKRREVGARSQLWNAKFDVARSGLPVPIPVAIALRRALGALLTIGGAGLATDLQIHQALGGEADHLAQQIRITALLYELSQVHHRFGHPLAVRALRSNVPKGGVIPRFRLAFATRPYRETR